MRRTLTPISCILVLKPVTSLEVAINKEAPHGTWDQRQGSQNRFDIESWFLFIYFKKLFQLSFYYFSLWVCVCTCSSSDRMSRLFSNRIAGDLGVALSCAPGAAFVLADICTVEWADKTAEYWSSHPALPSLSFTSSFFIYLRVTSLKMTVWAGLSTGCFCTSIRLFAYVYSQSITPTVFFLDSHSVFDDPLSVM